jgi:hypothetical protein
MKNTSCSIWELLPDFPTDSSGGPWFISFGHQTSVRGFWFVEGFRIPDWDERELTGSCPNGEDRSRDFMLAENGWPLFSDKLRSLIEYSFPNLIQFLPFTYASLNTPIKRMYIGQLLTLVDALDREHTKVDDDDWTPRANGTFRVQHPIVLKYRVVCEFPIMHVLGNPRPIYVRDDLKTLIEETNCSGVRFKSVMLNYV